MAITTSTGEQMTNDREDKARTRRAPKRVVRRKKKTTARKPGEVRAETEGINGNVAPAVTQVDVGDVAATSARATEDSVKGSIEVHNKGPKKTTRRRTRARKKTVGTTGPVETTETPQTDIGKDESTGPAKRVSRSRRGSGSRRGARPTAAQSDSRAKGNRQDGQASGGVTQDDSVGTSADESAVLDSKVSDVSERASAVQGEPIAADRATRPGQRSAGRRGRRGRGKGQKKEHGKTTAGDEEQAESAEGEVAVNRDPFPEISKSRIGREMVVNVSAGAECRISVLHDGRLEELFIERFATQSHVGNIYKGRVTNVEPSIQAVFVDFGLPKNGFLHISDVQPQYFPNHAGGSEDVGRKIPRHSRPVIQKCFRRGQEVIVQVTKEGVGTKGPTLTTYLSIPGRFLVMMPGMSRQGVSRKIVDEDDRREMREMLKQLTLPSGMGFILRTAGLGQTKRELQRDLNYLLRLWKTVVSRIKESPSPAELYQESDLVTRTIRDVYTSEFARLIFDDAETVQKAREFLHIAMPRSKPVIELYSGREPLFHKLGIESEIERIHMRHVPLPSGGSLVIDSTEAMVAIDVNSGRFRSVDDAEESAFKINLEAAGEIARQLRLRDLGGLIVCDFIDMRLDHHKRAVERAIRDELKKHKERARILRMSSFGLIEMTRQRQGPSYKRNIFFDCPHCKGAGVVKMPESVILDVMRFIQLAIHREQVQTVKVAVSSEVAFQILNNKRSVISEIEQQTGKQIIIHGEAGFTSDQIEYLCEDSRGQPVGPGQAGTAAT